MASALKRLAWALLLLAAAFPAAAHTLLDLAAKAAAILLTHSTATFAVAAGLLLISTLPALRRRFARRARVLRRVVRLATS
ncbi:hypothetical protein [Kitasatospora griseola]|uniref:hypothetical protein n=1 Tax=Kitasatospora griseola TaxID=2064 RepID=UPI0016701952|nr:hypothetical protein [Kitasatospora griseola]GGQ66242.1 hypothetical protein GCM10010195_22410 [Kitasatospora griseola]